MRNYLLIFLTVGFLLTVRAQKKLQEYEPVLAETLSRSVQIDPNEGFTIQKVTPSVHLLTDGIWQSIAIESDNEIILVDAPESFGAKIKGAVASVTSKPITTLVYSHGHSDHIGGSNHLSDVSGLEIIALSKTAEFLREQKDPRRLIPTKTFEGAYVLKKGNTVVHLNNHMNYHSPEGDLFISVPGEKFLMVIDVLAPGYVPFKNLDLSNNVDKYLKVFDQILGYDFDVFVGGHLTAIGNKTDVQETKDYVSDLYETVTRIHKSTDMMAVMAAAAQEIGWNNKYLLFKVFLDKIIDESAQEIDSRWTDKLSGVDVWSKSHAATMLNYVRWDD